MTRTELLNLPVDKMWIFNIDGDVKNWTILLLFNILDISGNFFNIFENLRMASVIISRTFSLGVNCLKWKPLKFCSRNNAAFQILNNLHCTYTHFSVNE